jgi:hypothetical protein
VVGITAATADGRGRDLVDGTDEQRIVGRFRAIGAVGYETTSANASKSSKLQPADTPRTACLSAVGASQPIDPRLQTIIESWAKLPETIRQSVLATIRSSKAQ